MLNAAVIGIGNMGKHHARIYSELSDVNLVAISDLNKELGQELAKKLNCKYYSDYQELLKNEKIDVVSIAVPTTLHKKVALDFINKKINVLLEKPICNDIADAKELISAAKKNNVKLLVGHIERYNPAIIELKELIKKGKLGDIISINATRAGTYPSQIKDSNIIVDVAIHDIDIINFLYESVPDPVFSIKGEALGKNKFDYVDILMKFGKKSGSVQCNWITPIKVRNLTVTGTKGYAELNYITQEIKLFESEISKTTDSSGDLIVKFGNSHSTDIYVKKEESLKLEIMNLINSINGKESLRIKPEEALKALEIVLEISNSKN